MIEQPGASGRQDEKMILASALNNKQALSWSLMC
jgi:hypothetical protein